MASTLPKMTKSYTDIQDASEHEHGDDAWRIVLFICCCGLPDLLETCDFAQSKRNATIKWFVMWAEKQDVGLLESDETGMDSELPGTCNADHNEADEVPSTVLEHHEDRLMIPDYSTLASSALTDFQQTLQHGMHSCRQAGIPVSNEVDVMHWIAETADGMDIKVDDMKASLELESVLTTHCGRIGKFILKITLP